MGAISAFVVAVLVVGAMIDSLPVVLVGLIGVWGLVK